MEPDTRQRLIQAAAHHYAESGFERMSVRAITQDAGANLSAVNYYFGSKEALLLAVFESAIHPMNADRLARLEAALSASEGAPLAVETVLDAFLMPMVEAAERTDGGPTTFLRAMARFLSEGDELMQRIDEKCFREIKRRFSLEFSRALPELPEEEVRWRFHFAIGSVIGTFMRHRVIARGDMELPRETLRAVVGHLRDFLAAGFRAPPPAVLLPLPARN